MSTRNLDIWSDHNINLSKKIFTKIILFWLIISISSCGKKPNADFSWSPTQPKAGENVMFNNTSTDAKKYDWNLGNMKISSEKNPSNVYDQPGNYIIDLTARKGGRSDTKTLTITIVP